jgi:DMSO/TMAO reductase YedYZ molybdopterin-dependent catalytic subunit
MRLCGGVITVNRLARWMRHPLTFYGWPVEKSDVTSAPPIAAMSGRARDLLAGLVGVVTAVVTLAVAALIALFFGLSNPLISVGSLVIDLAPAGVKDFAISLFGTGDKVFLLVVLGIIVFAASVAVGVLEVRRAPLGFLLFLVVAFVGLVAAVTRANASILDAVPTIAGTVVGILVLRALIARLERWRVAMTKGQPRTRSTIGALERRSFLQYAIAAGVAGIVVGTGASLITGASTAITAVRKKIKLPIAATPAPAIPAGAQLHIPGISPYIVPNADFYRIDTALQIPSIDPATWTLKITGMVENEVEISFAELEKLPLEEHLITLTCVSQVVGGELIGNARWLGYPIRHLLARAKPKAGADMVLSTSIDGFTAGSPLSVLQDDSVDALLAIGMNGEPLPLEHGFPVRMVVPGLYGYVSATKWVVNWKVTTFAEDQGYWTPRGWSAKGPIKLSSRIDTPTGNRQLKAGKVAIAGVAWEQHVGISAVDVQIDGGGWRSATLAEVVSVDTWLQWVYEWDATPGQHRIAVRATNTDGVVQTSRLADPAPNGSTGLHTITVSVA